jgi:hypothetical protein
VYFLAVVIGSVVGWFAREGRWYGIMVDVGWFKRVVPFLGMRREYDHYCMVGRAASCSVCVGCVGKCGGGLEIWGGGVCGCGNP